MTPSEEQPRSGRTRLVVVAALATLFLGAWGFALYQPAESLVDDFYRTLQLFVLESGNMAGTLPWQLDVARLAAPALTVASAAFVLAAVSSNEFDRWRARRRRGHVVVCGLGRRGTAAALLLQRAGYSVVGVEIDAEKGGTTSCRRAGIPVVVGDARDPIVLAGAGLPAAGHLVLLTPILELGGEIALSAIGLVPAGRASPLVIHLEIANPELAALLRAMTMTEHASPAWRLEELDLAGVGARAMLDAQSPWPSDADQAHVLIAGATPLGRALATLLRWRWRRFGGSDGGLTLTMIGDEGFAQPPASAPVSAAYVCIDDEAAALATSLAIMSGLPGTPVLVRLEKAVALADILRRDAPALRTVSLDIAVLTPPVLLDSTVERLARALHDAYRRTAPAADESAVSWDHLPDQLRSSNRAQAAHVARKMRATGRVLVPDDGSPIDDFTEDEIDILGRLEHERWADERLAAGWTPGPRDTAAKTSPYLVPWEELAEDVREIDRRFVRALPNVLADAGLLVRRTGPVVASAGG